MEEKLVELIELAEKENPAIASILLAVQSSLLINTEIQLMEHVAVFSIKQIEAIKRLN